MSRQQNTVRRVAPHSQKRELGRLLICVGLLVGSLALTVSLKHRPKPAIPAQVVATAPETMKPSPEVVAAYSVAADLPKYISIPTIETEKVRVFQLGLTKNYSIAAPTNIHDAGWYEESSRPGKPGAMFIYGHVSSLESKGIFYDLYKLKPGDVIRVTRGDDTVFSYAVVSTKKYAAQEVPMDTVLAPVRAGQQGLNLMTCAGHIDAKTGEFSERLVVYASLTKNER